MGEAPCRRPPLSTPEVGSEARRRHKLTLSGDPTELLHASLQKHQQLPDPRLPYPLTPREPSGPGHFRTPEVGGAQGGDSGGRKCMGLHPVPRDVPATAAAAPAAAAAAADCGARPGLADPVPGTPSPPQTGDGSSPSCPLSLGPLSSVTPKPSTPRLMIPISWVHRSPNGALTRQGVGGFHPVRS